MGREVMWDLAVCELLDLQREGHFGNCLAQVRFQVLKGYFMSASQYKRHHNPVDLTLPMRPSEASSAIAVGGGGRCAGKRPD